MDEKRKVAMLAAVFFGLIALAAGVYYIFFSGGRPNVPEKIQVQAPAVKETETVPDQTPVFPATSLDNSDDLIRKLSKELSTSPRLDAWLQSKDLVRKITAAVDSIADGLSPAKQIDFFIPEDKFEVFNIGPAEYLDPKSYERYNLPVEVFVSFDPKETVRYYHGLKPLFQDAYKELGYPNKDFDQTLKKALVELLETPVVEGDIRLEKKVKTYAFADPKLEGLSEAQKHFLRLGPGNVGAVQIKLREMVLALGLPADQIPRPCAYSTR